MRLVRLVVNYAAMLVPVGIWIVILRVFSDDNKFQEADWNVFKGKRWVFE